jgi:hypothetical protein
VIRGEDERSGFARGVSTAAGRACYAVTMNKLIVVVGIASLALVAGCKAKKKNDGGGAAAGGGGSGAGAGGGTGTGGGTGGGGGAGPTRIDKLGLSAELPSGATVADSPVGSGVMITGGTVGARMIEAASDTAPKTLEAAKEEASMYTPLNVKEEVLADGWALTFENKGGAGTNYWVMARRELSGKPFKCETTASTAEQQAAVLAACKSLK